MSVKPYSQACENNKQPILERIRPLLQTASSLLEIGSGTGQHAAYFSEVMPHILWQTSDVEENHQGIQCWVDDCQSKNILPPLTLNVLNDSWPESKYDAVFSANTAHIMPWEAVVAMFAGVAECLNQNGLFILYGPFNYGGQFTSASNRQFEVWLKSVDPARGIRDFEAIEQLAVESGFSLESDFEMPANNRLLVWRLVSQKITD